MASIADILPAVLARLLEAPALVDAAGAALVFRHEDDGLGELPASPSPFVYIEHEQDSGSRSPVEFGGGREQNTYRNPGTIVGYVMVPKGHGLPFLASTAERFAARLRSYRSDAISCFAARVYLMDSKNMRPGGAQSEVDNYICAIVRVAMHFDQVG